MASAATGTTSTPVASTVRPSPRRHRPVERPAPVRRPEGDETVLTGDALAKVTAAAEAKVPGGTVIRVETDADGHAKYEAHMTDASGNPITVYVDDSYNVVSTGTPA